MLTARADDELRLRMLREGASDYVMKPFSLAEVRARVGNLIGAKLADEKNRRLVTELHEQNVRLTRTTAQLEEANRELESFSYTVSHDLRAPLRSIDGFSQALLEDLGPQLGETSRRHLLRVRAASQRMGLLIDDLLKLARVTRATLRFAPVDLTALAERVIAELRQAQPEHVVDAQVEPGLRAHGDAALLQIVLDNLLGNAWKYTGKTSGARVVVGLEYADGEPTFFVRDNGAGFDMQLIERLFNPFSRLHSDDDFPGVGVGLATVRRIIQRHGGRIWAEGRVGRGATFWLRLPAVAMRHEQARR
jgi:signal transduction histidine kinase